MHRLPAIAAAVAGVLFVLAAARLNAQPRITVDCEQYAAFAARIAEYREVGAPLARVLDKVVREQALEPVRRLLMREARRVYAQGRPPDQAAYEAYKRCQDQLGAFPLEG